MSKSNSNSKHSEDPPDPITGLNLSGSGILNLPPSIGIFTHITMLNISSNQLKSLPADIGKLVQLEKLDASKNMLGALPREIGRLHKLKDLDVRDNQISTLPVEMGRLVRLEKLRIDGNPITSPPYEIITKDVRSIVFWLRDRIESSGQIPPRRWVTKPSSSAHSHTPDQAVKVMCYNVLSPSYATTALYPHCPSWALDWSYRSGFILRELQAYQADIICLQEVEIDHFENFFTPELAKLGYDGIHRPKSRYKTMSDADRRFVDGCAIFWQSNRFSLHTEHLIDFVEQTIARGDAFLQDHEAFNRLVSKDNIGLVALLEMKSNGQNGNFPSLSDSRLRGGKGGDPFSGEGEGSGNTLNVNPNSKYLLVCNTHIHWNPEFMDVKLMQAQLLVEEIQKLMPPHTRLPTVLCGDFNSTPDSGVWEFMDKGHLPSTHEDFGKLQWGNYTHGGGCKHHLNINSAYKSVLGREPEFTNWSFEFRGCLSYVWFSRDHMRVHRILETLKKDLIEEEVAMPNSFCPSDHVSLLAEFVMTSEPEGQQSARRPTHPQQRNFHTRQRV